MSWVGPGILTFIFMPNILQLIKHETNINEFYSVSQLRLLIFILFETDLASFVFSLCWAIFSCYHSKSFVDLPAIFRNLVIFFVWFSLSISTIVYMIGYPDHWQNWRNGVEGCGCWLELPINWKPRSQSLWCSPSLPPSLDLHGNGGRLMPRLYFKDFYDNYLPAVAWLIRNCILLSCASL